MIGRISIRPSSEPNIDEVQDALSAIKRGGMRASEVIHGLGALAKKSGPQLAKLDIDDVIRKVLAVARGELLRHNVVLRAELAAEGKPIAGDQVRLQQVLLNLIMNGVEPMREVTERARELAVSSTLAEQGSVLVAVEDTGTGWIRQSRNAFSSPSTRRSGRPRHGTVHLPVNHRSPRWALVGVAARAARRRCPLHRSGMGRKLAPHHRTNKHQRVHRLGIRKRKEHF